MNMKVPCFLCVLIHAVVALSFSSCKMDPCDGIVCENGGACIDGGCACTEGWTGLRCEVEIDACTLQRCEEAGTDSCVISPLTGEARCVCNNGFEGGTCESRWEDKFAGSYTVAELCDGLAGNFPMAVETGPEPGEITLVNFANRQPNNLPAKIVGNLLSGNAFQIETQFMSFGEISGQGGYRTDGGIEYSYELILAGDTSNCSVLMTPS